MGKTLPTKWAVLARTILGNILERWRNTDFVDLLLSSLLYQTQSSNNKNSFTAIFFLFPSLALFFNHILWDFCHLVRLCQSVGKNFPVFDNNAWVNCFYCSIFIERRIVEDGNIFSLNYIFRMIFIPVWGWFYPVVITDLLM